MIKEKITKLLKKNNYKFFHIIKTESTMNDVRSYVECYKKNCLFLADEQIKGRGQRGNKWDSPPGNVYCSVSFDNFLGIKNHFLFSILIALSIKMTLDKFKVKNVFFKWPNDIFYKKKKFAGLISEIIKVSEDKSFVVIGFGINFISNKKFKTYNATYLKSFCDVESIEDFLLSFIKTLFLNLNLLKMEGENKFIKFFSKSLLFINEEIKILLPNNTLICGIFRGINVDGSLRLDIENKIEKIYNGRIQL